MQLLTRQIVLSARAGIQVHVHVCEARHQVLAAAVNLQRAVRHFDRIGRTNRRDAPVTHDDRLCGEDSFAVKRDDVDVDESDSR